LLDVSLTEAARISRQSKSTIWRAINSGRLSATRTYTGDYQIDPAELHRFSLRTGETVPDGPTADTGSERFLTFGFLSVCTIAEIAWLTALAWATLWLLAVL
jgi:hypothetical protein